MIYLAEVFQLLFEVLRKLKIIVISGPNCCDKKRTEQVCWLEFVAPTCHVIIVFVCLAIVQIYIRGFVIIQAE